jgi:hypothetical protein
VSTRRNPTTLARLLVGVGVGGAFAYLVGLALPSPPVRLATKAVPVPCLATWVLSAVAGALGHFVAAEPLLSAAGDLLLERGHAAAHLAGPGDRRGGGNPRG